MQGIGAAGYAVLAILWVASTAWLRARFGGAPVWQVALLSSAIVLQLPPYLQRRKLGASAPPARVWIGWWALAFFVADLLQALISELFGNNLGFFLFANPIEDGCILWAYSYWQTRPVMRLSFRVAVPVLAIASTALAIGAGEAGGFLAISGPFRLLVIAAAVAFTLVSRAVQESGAIWRRDWLWISLGALLYYSAFVVVNPVSKMLMTDSPQLAQLVYVVKAVVDSAAFLMVWQGMRCPVETSSPSTSPSSLPSL